MSMSQINFARLYKTDLKILCWDNTDTFLQRVFKMIIEEGRRLLDISMSQVNIARLYCIVWQT